MTTPTTPQDECPYCHGSDCERLCIRHHESGPTATVRCRDCGHTREGVPIKIEPQGSDLIERLRAMSRYEHDDLTIIGDEAADEIARLSAKLADVRRQAEIADCGTCDILKRQILYVLDGEAAGNAREEQ